jgi:hypothetical protein
VLYESQYTCDSDTIIETAENDPLDSISTVEVDKYPTRTMDNCQYGVTQMIETTFNDELEHSHCRVQTLHQLSALEAGFETGSEALMSEPVCYNAGQVVPAEYEFINYQHNGTYLDVNRVVCKSHHWQQTEKDIHDSEVKAMNEGRDFVIKVPQGFKQAFDEQTFGPYWRTAIYKELVGLYEMGCFTLAPKTDPTVMKTGTIPGHFVFTAKWSSDVPPKFSKFKARLVAGGNWEVDNGLPYENYSPAAGAVTNRIFDAYCTLKGFSVQSTDMTQAFLNSPAIKDIFVTVPHGLPGFDGHCMALLKMLYGLRASPRAWIDTLTKVMVKMGFRTCPDEPSLMRRKVGQSEIICCIYVDDVKWGTNDTGMLEATIAELGRHFALTNDGTLSTYIGLKYEFSKDENGMHVTKVNQTSYSLLCVDRFGLTDVDTTASKYDTPLPPAHGRSNLKDIMGSVDSEVDKVWREKYSYPCIVGSLIHAMVHTRPDIAYAVSQLSRAVSCPEPYHYKAARHLLCYIKNTVDLGIEYRQAEMLKYGNHYLRGAVDSSFADCDDTHRSTSGYVIWFGGAPLEWECKRQPLVTMSTMESEYVAASKCILGIRSLTWY